MASTIKVDTIDTPSSSGNITVSRPLSGSGASLTNLPAANLTGTLPAISGANLTALNATNLGSGTVPDARLPSTLADTSLSNLSATGKNKVCLAWINFNGTGTIAIRDSYNVSSISDIATGIQQISFNTSPSNANYSVTASAQIGNSDRVFVSGSTSGGVGIGTSWFILRCVFYSGGNQDCSYVHAQVFGDY